MKDCTGTEQKRAMQQNPPEHTWVPVHAVAQSPQCCLAASRSKHCVPQQAGVTPAVQTLPQKPQSVRLLLTTVHVPPQHLPALHGLLSATLLTKTQPPAPSHCRFWHWLAHE